MNILFAAVPAAVIQGVHSYQTQKKIAKTVEKSNETLLNQAARNRQINDLEIAESNGHQSVFPKEMTGIRHLELMIAQTIN